MRLVSRQILKLVCVYSLCDELESCMEIIRPWFESHPSDKLWTLSLHFIRWKMRSGWMPVMNLVQYLAFGKHYHGWL